MSPSNNTKGSMILGRIFEATPSSERRIVLFHIGAAPALALIVLLSRARLPYWEFALGAFAAIFVVNLLLLMWSQRLGHLVVAALGSSLDTALLLAVSSVAIRASAFEASASELWLIFPLVIVGGAYRFRLWVSVLHAVILSGWYSAHVILAFPIASRSFTELPVRVGFFMLMGVLCSVMAYALRKEGTAPPGHKEDPPPRP